MAARNIGTRRIFTSLHSQVHGRMRRPRRPFDSQLTDWRRPSWPDDDYVLEYSFQTGRIELTKERTRNRDCVINASSGYALDPTISTRARLSGSRTFVARAPRMA